MALFKILKGDSSRISTDVTPFHDGYAYFTPDDSGFYIDSEDNGVQKRHRINPEGGEFNKLVFGEQIVQTSAWQSDGTYTSYPFRASVTLANVTEDYISNVIFDVPDATSGNLAPVSVTYDGGVYIYAVNQPTANVTIANIICQK